MKSNLNNVNPIGLLIRRYLKSMGKEEEFVNAALTNHWEEIAGKPVASVTVHLALMNKIVYIKVTSPIIKTQLMMSKDLLKRRITEILDYTIESIVIF
jgi:hypothetical protein